MIGFPWNGGGSGGGLVGPGFAAPLQTGLGEVGFVNLGLDW